jgi:hypothetical protein
MLVRDEVMVRRPDVTHDCCRIVSARAHHRNQQAYREVAPGRVLRRSISISRMRNGTGTRTYPYLCKDWCGSCGVDPVCASSQCRHDGGSFSLARRGCSDRGSHFDNRCVSIVGARHIVVSTTLIGDNRRARGGVVRDCIRETSHFVCSFVAPKEQLCLTLKMSCGTHIRRLSSDETLAIRSKSRSWCSTASDWLMAHAAMRQSTPDRMVSPARRADR